MESGRGQGVNADSMKFLDALKKTADFLDRAGIESPPREAEMIIAHCTEADRTVLHRDNPEISQDVLGCILRLSQRRARREPLQYIFGLVDFCGLKIKVGRGVLIPRPETELLVEEAISLFARVSQDNTDLAAGTQSEGSMGWKGKILDLCTGSGCIALAIAAAFRQAQVYGTDSSGVALEYAKESAALNNIHNTGFLRGNLFEPLDKNMRFDLIIANPPYIKHDDLENLQPEIHIWEPAEALDGGKDGLDYYRAILGTAADHLEKGGTIMLELGIGQAEAVRRIAKESGLRDIQVQRDYGGIERILSGKSGMV